MLGTYNYPLEVIEGSDVLLVGDDGVAQEEVAEEGGGEHLHVAGAAEPRRIWNLDLGHISEECHRNQEDLFFFFFT